MKENNFTNIAYNIRNLDRYYIRKSIFKAINSSLHLLKGRLLDVGCGEMPYKKYIIENSTVNNYTGLDIEYGLQYANSKPDALWDGKTMPFSDEHFDTVIATEVFEHIPDLDRTLAEINRVLKNGGTMFFTVPFLWPLHEVPNDECRYTPFLLQRKLHNSGFKDIDIKALGGWNASLAQMLGLWVRRKPFSKRNRFLISMFLKPIIWLLIKRDNNEITFKESSMITGLYGVVKK